MTPTTLCRRPSVNRTNRTDFLYDMLLLALNHGGQGFFTVAAKHVDDENPSRTWVDIVEERTGAKHRVTLYRMRRAMASIRRAGYGPGMGQPRTWVPMVDKKTGRRLYLSWTEQYRLADADRMLSVRTLGVDDALCVLQVAVFGQKVYV
ncbi:hypothetical protein [Micromonospora sp. NPDC048839]|uniref:hypothetical protein n=1 Tax=Micromonospora sp. NPDC048839 TaxID=3155641 RepID=UPI0033F75825